MPMIPYKENLIRLFAPIAMLASLISAAAFVMPLAVLAAISPTLSLNPIGNGTITMSVAGDEDASIELYYYNSANVSIPVGTIGSTGANGYLSTTIYGSEYGISAGALAYVVVDGAVSSPVAWPSSYTTVISNPPYNYPYTPSPSSPISLSQNNINLSVGQSLSVTLSGGSGSYYVSQGSSFIGSTVTGNTLDLYGDSNTNGEVTLVICSTDNSCADLYVSVLPGEVVSPVPVYTYPSYPTSYPTYPISYPIPSVSLSQSNVYLNIGQSQSVGIYGNGSYYISSNSNPSVVSTSLIGNSLYIQGNYPGTSNVTICENGSSCATLYVDVVTSAPAPALFSFIPNIIYRPFHQILSSFFPHHFGFL